MYPALYHFCHFGFSCKLSGSCLLALRQASLGPPCKTLPLSPGEAHWPSSRAPGPHPGSPPCPELRAHRYLDAAGDLAGQGHVQDDQGLPWRRAVREEVAPPVGPHAPLHVHPGFHGVHSLSPGGDEKKKRDERHGSRVRQPGQSPTWLFTQVKETL